MTRLVWYLRRLAAMSPAEVRYRLDQRLRTAWERQKNRRRSAERRGGMTSRISNLEPDSLLEAFRQATSNYWIGFDHPDQLRQEIQTLFPSNSVITMQQAGAICDGRLTLFGREFQYDAVPSWHRDPISGREWPRRFWGDVDIRDGQTIGGVKWVWELNRHHHLVTLGKAFFLSNEECFAEQVCTQLADWIQANPLHTGVNWTSPLELAVRLINWTWALAFVRHSRALTADLFVLILRSVAEQTQHIARHLSAYSSANNHLIGEAAGLAVIGMCFPWLQDASRWCDVGLKILARELEKQIYADGVPAEQAIHYLAFVLDFNLLAWRMAELNGLEIPEVWYDRLAAACNLLQHIMDEQGNVPSIGDSDDGCVVRLDDRPEANNYCSILAAAAVLLNCPDFKASAGSWDEKSHWLLGASGLAAFDSLHSEAPQTSRAFKDGGYCVMRAPGRVIVFDCGPLGFLSIAAHGHADALSLTASVEGEPLLVDPGTYAYQEGDGQRDFFRSTAAHNTVLVDGHDQSEMLGTFLWGRKANARLLRWSSTPEYDLASAEHDGYVKMGITHRRTVLFYKPDWLLVADRLQGKGIHSFEQLWHLPAGCQVAIEADRAELAIGQKRFAIMPVQTPGAETQLRRGEKQPMQGWSSPDYGEIEPAPVISFSGQSYFPIRLVTALHLAPIPEGNAIPVFGLQLLDLLDRLEKEVA
jgi:hypothetical protein